MNFQRLMTIGYRRTKTLLYPCCCMASRTMSSMACWRVLIRVSKEVSNWVTGNEVSDTTLLSAVRRLQVRLFSQFYSTQTRQRVTICQIIIKFVKSVKYTRWWRVKIIRYLADVVRCSVEAMNRKMSFAKFTVWEIQAASTQSVCWSRNATVVTWIIYAIPHITM